MDFEILPYENIKDDELIISLPSDVRQGLGLLLGQMLQFNVGKTELFLEVRSPLQDGQREALVSAKAFSVVGQKEISYNIPVITLGCDPEFFITYRGRKVSAATYLPFEGQVGCDGGLGELRPMYGRHESQVVRNLGQLIKEIPSRMKRADWAEGVQADPLKMEYVAHSYFQGIAAGFHVHLGIPPEILNTREDVSRPVLDYLTKILDWYVSVPTVLLEPNDERRCGQSEYGKPGDYRTTNVTLEYRTPGAFFLRNPILSGGLMGLSLLMIEYAVGEIKERSQNFSRLRKMPKEELLDVLPIPKHTLVKAALTQKDKSLARRAYPVIKDKLRKLSNYEAHRQAVEYFFSVVDEGIIPKPNLIPNWEECT